MPGICRLLVALACLHPHVGPGQVAAATERPACDPFLGLWSGTWSQGYYGTQRIRPPRPAFRIHQLGHGIQMPPGNGLAVDGSDELFWRGYGLATTRNNNRS